METFSRMVKKDEIDPDHAKLREVEVHIRQHLSSICDPDDDPERYYSEVTVRWETRENGDVLVVGEIARLRVAPYLEEGWTPEDDVAGNPLSVPSIEDVHEDLPLIGEIEQPKGQRG